ncbi:hypothetical protein TYRP_022452 [Tyrophagus putrescentiae]|nr:hypothetical protein TYRP_022452 [Tyrophagus putrescentiae]
MTKLARVPLVSKKKKKKKKKKSPSESRSPTSAADPGRRRGEELLGWTRSSHHGQAPEVRPTSTVQGSQWRMADLRLPRTSTGPKEKTEYKSPRTMPALQRRSTPAVDAWDPRYRVLASGEAKLKLDWWRA